QKYSQKDSTFLMFYNDVRKLADSVYISSSISPEFRSLKYNSVFDLQNNFVKEFEKLKSEAGVREEWRLKFEEDIDNFRSDSLRFRNYISENDLGNFLDIEVTKIYESSG